MLKRYDIIKKTVSLKIQFQPKTKSEANLSSTRTKKTVHLIRIPTQTIALAALAILGHKSAHSFPIGPVIAEPIILKSEPKLLRLQAAAKNKSKQEN